MFNHQFYIGKTFLTFHFIHRCGSHSSKESSLKVKNLPLGEIISVKNCPPLRRGANKMLPRILYSTVSIYIKNKKNL